MFNSNQDKDKILSQLEEVRNSGEVNMMDAAGVQRVASEKGLHSLVIFLGSNPSRRGADRYMNLLDEFEEWMKENE